MTTVSDRRTILLLDNGSDVLLKHKRGFGQHGLNVISVHVNEEKTIEDDAVLFVNSEDELFRIMDEKISGNRIEGADNGRYISQSCSHIPFALHSDQFQFGEGKAHTTAEVAEESRAVFTDRLKHFAILGPFDKGDYNGIEDALKNMLRR
jgi:hypothetical protein